MPKEPAVEADEELIRRVRRPESESLPAPHKRHANGRLYPTSNRLTLRNQEEGLSFYRASLLKASRAIDAVAQDGLNPNDFELMATTASAAIELGYEIVCTPDSHGLPGHCELIPPTRHKRHAKQLQRKCIIITPDEVRHLDAGQMLDIPSLLK